MGVQARQAIQANEDALGRKVTRSISGNKAFGEVASILVRQERLVREFNQNRHRVVLGLTARGGFHPV